MDLPSPTGSGPAGTRPVLVLQVDSFNRSAIRTVVVAAISSNEALAQAPGNVLVHRAESGLKKTSVVNVSQIVTIDKEMLRDRIGMIPGESLAQVERGVRLVLGL